MPTVVEHKKSTRAALTARSLKVSIVLSPAEMLGQPVPEGKPRIILRIQVPGRTVTADVGCRSLRKAQSTIREHGAEACVVVLQGKLEPDNSLAEAGLAVQLKTTGRGAQ